MREREREREERKKEKNGSKIQGKKKERKKKNCQERENIQNTRPRIAKKKRISLAVVDRGFTHFVTNLSTLRRARASAMIESPMAIVVGKVHQTSRARR